MNILTLGVLWLAFVIICYVGLLSAGLWYLAPFNLLIIQNAAHESVHGNLLPSKLLNEVAGALLYALVGHNVYLLGHSHSLHHKYGRYPDARYLVERRHERYGWLEVCEYYGLLLGTGYWWNVFGGYVCAILPAKQVEFYGSKTTSRRKFLATQFLVLGFHASFLAAFWDSYLLCMILFSVMWGLTQNSPHYGLENSKDAELRHIARSYRVPRIVHFMFFGSIFSHVQHHFFQDIPGLRLNDPSLDKQIGERLGVRIRRKPLLSWPIDMLRQFLGPRPRLMSDWKL